MAKILKVLARAGVDKVFDPTARALLRARIPPDAVTVAGTAGVLAGAVVFGARGHLVAGALIVTLFAFTDLIDGSMARQSGRTGKFGAFLDSTMDRVADGSVFAAVTYWLATQGRHWGVVAEGLGMTANVGLAERAERLILLGLGGMVEGLGVRYGLDVALWLLAALSLVTIGQRIATVYRQDRRNYPDRPGHAVRPDPSGPGAAR